MRKLKRLVLVAALCVGFAGTSYADDPCAVIPGQTNTPPCATAQQVSDGDIALDATAAPTPASDTSDYSITDLTLAVVVNLLALF
jgi:hypothetical protein